MKKHILSVAMLALVVTLTTFTSCRMPSRVRRLSAKGYMRGLWLIAKSLCPSFKPALRQAQGPSRNIKLRSLSLSKRRLIIKLKI